MAAATRGPRRLAVVAAASLAAVSFAVAVPDSPARAAGESGLVSVQPARLLDTRAGGVTIDGAAAGIGATTAGVPLAVQVTGRGGVPVSGVAAAVVNVTVDNATPNTGYLTVFPTGTPRPVASSLDYTPGAVVANEVIAALGTGGTISIVTQTSTHVVVDVVGWVPTAASGITAAAPLRYLDTRTGEPTFDGVAAGAGATVGGVPLDLTVAGRGAVPSAAVAVIVNVTVVNPGPTTGFVTVFPSGTVRPLASSLNYAPGQVVANELVAKVGTGGRISLFTQTSTHLVVDVVGWFVGTAGLRALSPARLLDTRTGNPTVDGRMQGGGRTTAGGEIRLPVLGRGGVPTSGVWAVVVNVTVPNTGGAGGYVTVYPDGHVRPTASSLNVAAGAIAANELVAKVGPSGAIRIFTQLPTDVVVDVVGWFPSPGGDAEAAPQPTVPEGSGPHVQAVYAVPADRSAVAGREAAIAHEVGVAQAWYDTQTGGRHPAFARTNGVVSVLRVQLTSTASAVSTAKDPESLVDAQVRAQLGAAVDGVPIAVVLEGSTTTSGTYCGRTGAMVFIPIANCAIAPLASSTWPYGMSYLLAHELTHLLGAVAACAPHVGGGGHVIDDPRDVLYNGPAARDWDHLMLDPGHDDYYGNGASGCTDIADSELLGTG